VARSIVSWKSKGDNQAAIRHAGRFAPADNK
jgi:hypothetical protein